MRTYRCIKCGKKIKKRDYPWCPLCRYEEFQKAKGRAKITKKNNMLKNQLETDTIPETETPEVPETVPEGDDKKEEEEEEE